MTDVLRILWKEWEIFIVLRFEFLAARSFGHDTGLDENQVIQYRNSCLVDCIPPAYRSDQSLYNYMEALFPGQVKRIEVLVNAKKLSDMIEQRKRNIISYEDTYARHVHAKRKYERYLSSLEQGKMKLNVWSFLCSYRSDPEPPSDPMINIGTWFQKERVKALPRYLAEIKTLNDKIEREADKLLAARQTLKQKFSKQKKRSSQTIDVVRQVILRNTIQAVSIIGEADEISDTAFVEFKNLTTKQIGE